MTKRSENVVVDMLKGIKAIKGMALSVPVSWDCADLNVYIVVSAAVYQINVSISRSITSMSITSWSGTDQRSL